jgi:hypothetical protein
VSTEQKRECLGKGERKDTVFALSEGARQPSIRQKAVLPHKEVMALCRIVWLVKDDGLLSPIVRLHYHLTLCCASDHVAIGCVQGHTKWKSWKREVDCAFLKMVIYEGMRKHAKKIQD